LHQFLHLPLHPRLLPSRCHVVPQATVQGVEKVLAVHLRDVVVAVLPVIITHHTCTHTTHSSCTSCPSRSGHCQRH
jgi:hypothetical protein